MKTIELSCFGIQLTLDTENPGGGSITSDLQERCPHCGQFDCHYSCDKEGSSESESRIACNRAFDGVESLILAHACAGIDVESPAYKEGIETAVAAIGNNL